MIDNCQTGLTYFTKRVLFNITSSLATSKKNLIMNYFFEIKSKALLTIFFKDIVFLFFPIASKRDIILNNAQRDKTHIRRYELHFLHVPKICFISCIITQFLFSFYLRKNSETCVLSFPRKHI